MPTPPAPAPRTTSDPARPATAHDVARVAGVSAITVSRALNSPAQLSEATLARVRQAIAQTGYVPNLLARNLNANKSTRLVAAIVPTISGPIFAASVQALGDALARERYQLMLGQTNYEDAREDDLLDAIIGRRPDGIVLTGIVRSAGGRRRLQTCGIPVVETWDLTDDPVDMLVGFSHEDAGQAVCQYLYDTGRRRLALIAASDERAARRNRAFQARARALGLAPVAIAPSAAPGTLAGGRTAFAALMQADPGIDGVFCSSDMLALGVLTEAQCQRVGVPDRVSVVGFGDLDFSAGLYPALTSVRIDASAIGGQAARFIIDRAEGRPIASPIVNVGFTLIPRASS